MHEVACVKYTRGWCIELNELITRTCGKGGEDAKGTGMPRGIPASKTLKTGRKSFSGKRGGRKTCHSSARGARGGRRETQKEPEIKQQLRETSKDVVGSN